MTRRRPLLGESSPISCAVTETVFRGLFLSAGLLVVIHVLVHLTWRIHHALPSTWLEVLDLADERGLATWMTVVSWSAVGGVCCALGAMRRGGGWYLLGAFFLYLSADDSAMLHERVGWMNARLAEGTGTYAWVLLLGPVFAVLGGLAFRALWRGTACDRRARARATLAFVFLGTALLIEVGERRVVDSGLRWRGFPAYRYAQAVEETLELFAPLLLAHAVARLLEGECRTRSHRIAPMGAPRQSAQPPPRDVA